MTDVWSETALIAISAQGGSNMKFACMTETVDIDIGDKDFDVISGLCGSRMIKFNPQDVTTVTLEAYPLQAGTVGQTTATTGTGFFDLVNSDSIATDTTQPLSISVDRSRNPYRIAILWTDKTTETDATAAITAPANTGMRFVAAGGYFTSVKPSFTDKILKFTVNYKVAPFDNTGSANIKLESVAGAATLTMASLASYTTATKW